MEEPAFKLCDVTQSLCDIHKPNNVALLKIYDFAETKSVQFAMKILDFIGFFNIYWKFIEYSKWQPPGFINSQDFFQNLLIFYPIWIEFAADCMVI